MPTAYIYSPFTGKNWAAASYCFPPYGTHPVTTGGFSNPIDVGNPSGTTGTFVAYMSSIVASISVSHESPVCVASTGATAPWQNKVRVRLYSGFNATGTYIGDAMYAHAQLQYVSGVYNRPSNANWGIAIGVTCPNTCNCNANGCCYCGVHVHMEGRAAIGSFTRTSAGCDTWLYEGSTIIYTYTW